MLRFFQRMFTGAAEVEAAVQVEAPKAEAIAPAKQRKPRQKRAPGTRLPNGVVLQSRWYRPPSFAAHGRMTLSQVRAMDAEYLRWKAEKDRAVALPKAA